MTTQLQHANVRKSNGTDATIDGIKLEVRDGEILALVGPKGCGNATVLRLMAGLEPAVPGSVYVNGDDVADAAWQAIRLHNTSDIDRGDDDIALIIEGMQTATTTLCLITVAADPARSHHDQLAAAHKRGGAIVLATHDLVTASGIADTVAVMDAGKIAQIGTPADIVDEPADMHVAGLAAKPAMNFIAGTALQVTPVSLTFLPEGGAPLTLQNRGFALRNDAAVTLGIRPKNLHFDPRGPLRATYLGREAIAGLTYLHCQIGETDFYVVADVDRPFAHDDEIGLAIDLGDVHLFDTATGKSLKARK